MGTNVGFESSNNFFTEITRFNICRIWEIQVKTYSFISDTIVAPQFKGIINTSESKHSESSLEKCHTKPRPKHPNTESI